jgi:type I restriction enzyme, S subunit
MGFSHKVTLKDITTSMYSGGTPSRKKSEYWENGTIPWLKTNQIGEFIIYGTDEHITEAGLNGSSAKLVRKNSLVIAMYGDGVTRGKVSIVGKDLTTNQACCNLEIDSSKADYKFIYYLLKQNYKVLRHLSNGGAQQNLSVSMLKEFELEIPSLLEQKAIAYILSTIDKKIEINNQINENLQSLAQLLFKHWFIDFEFPNEEGLPYRSCGGELVDSELGMIPKVWKIDKIEGLQPKLETGKRPKGGVGGFDTGIPSIGAESIKGIGYFDYSKTKYVPIDFAASMKKGIVSGYELLIYKDGGKPGYFMPNFSMFGEGFPYDSFVLNEHVFLLDFGDKNFNIFSYFHLQSEYIRHLLHTAGCKAAIPGINQKDILDLYIFSKDNPKVKEFCDIVSPMITTILKNSKQNRILSQLRDTLLTELMNGEIDLSNLEINL